MATAAVLQVRLDAIEAAMAGGLKSVMYENRRVEYMTFAEMRAARDDIQRQLQIATDGAVSSGRTVAAFNSGL